MAQSKIKTITERSFFLQQKAKASVFNLVTCLLAGTSSRHVTSAAKPNDTIFVADETIKTPLHSAHKNEHISTTKKLTEFK